MNGKGSKPRPIKNIKNYISNWEEINWKPKSLNTKKSTSNGAKPMK
jgi:hypothetical protein